MIVYSRTYAIITGVVQRMFSTGLGGDRRTSVSPALFSVQHHLKTALFETVAASAEKHNTSAEKCYADGTSRVWRVELGGGHRIHHFARADGALSMLVAVGHRFDEGRS